MATHTGTTRGTGDAAQHRDHSHRSNHHFLEMFGVMLAGMIASAAIFLTIVGMTWDEATLRHPQTSLLVIAAGMTVPMAVWMLHRGMGVRNTAEMAAAMAVPVVPFLCLVWFGVTRSAWCAPYCIVSTMAMVWLMLRRREQYAVAMAHA